jgi:predicted nucleic acid-binding protein
LAVSTISLFELGFGVVGTGDGDLQRLLRSLQWAEFLDYSPQDALEGAAIQSELQDAGSRIPIADMMIAGVARNRGATLVTKDGHFDRVERVQVDFYAD